MDFEPTHCELLHINSVSSGYICYHFVRSGPLVDTKQPAATMEEKCRENGQERRSEMLKNCGPEMLTLFQYI